MKFKTLLKIILGVFYSLGTARGDFRDSDELQSLNGTIQNSEGCDSVPQNNLTCSEETTHLNEGNNTTFSCWCIRVCHKDLTEKYKLEIPSDDFNITISLKNETRNVTLKSHFKTHKNYTCHEDDYLLIPEEFAQDEFSILSNGSLKMVNSTPDSNFCLASNGSKIEIIKCYDFEKKPGKPTSIEAYLYPIFMSLSVVFLFFILMAYFISSDMKNLHGKNIACQSATLMIAFSSLVIVYTGLPEIGGVFCKILAYVSYTFFMSSFCWLNAMCFDIFLTFSNFKKMAHSRHQTQKKFRTHAIYSTTVPITLLITVLCMDNFLSEESSMWPGMGHTNCWFYDAGFKYFHLPAFILFSANILFFLVTIVKIIKMKKEAKVLKKDSSRSKYDEKAERKRLILCAKLFIIMGGSLIAESLSGIFGHTWWIWKVTDLINCLRGAMIFYFSVWANRKLRKSLLARIGVKLGDDSPEDNTNKSSSSTHRTELIRQSDAKDLNNKETGRIVEDTSV